MLNVKVEELDDLKSLQSLKTVHLLHFIFIILHFTFLLPVIFYRITNKRGYRFPGSLVVFMKLFVSSYRVLRNDMISGNDVFTGFTKTDCSLAPAAGVAVVVFVYPRK